MLSFDFFRKSARRLTLVAAVALCLASCGREPDKPSQSAFSNGVFILNEGLLHQNNSTLSFYDLDKKTLTYDVFTSVNKRGLGDIGNDLQRYGGRLYCVVNNSNIVEVMDAATAKSLKTISLPGKQPRHIAFLGGKAYISCFDGDIVKIDTATCGIEGMLHTGPNPDGICACNGKLYVANSGGLNTHNYGNTVSVVDPGSFTVTKDITVEINPTRIRNHGNDYIYVVSNGNYSTVPFTLQKINCHTDKLEKTFDIEALNIAIHGEKAYIYSYNYSTQESWIKVMNLATEELETESFITDGTKIKTPYMIEVNPSSGDVWISDVGNYTANGDVYCFDRNGRKKLSFEAGLCPSSICFMK
ncbi:MAG: hypothetical protein SPL42_08005 [Bacteroidales bacterium]|nr:hypothetical protein [Bacteroidales bacterium]MDY6348350.1 hypothetical protein [Bacteroidales bacterium]